MRLSKHVTINEFIRSEKANSLKIDNSLTEEHKNNAILLCENVFEPIREHFNVPIYISSGYRSKTLNSKIKGSSKTSQHSKGQAMDLDCKKYGGLTNMDIFKYIKDNLIFDQLIYEGGTNKEPEWVHVSYVKKGNRNQVLKMVRVNDKPKYIPWK